MYDYYNIAKDDLKNKKNRLHNLFIISLFNIIINKNWGKKSNKKK